MAKIVFYCMPFLHLVTSGIRNDFEAALGAIKYVNYILNSGLIPHKNEFDEVALKGQTSPRPLWEFGRHYPEASNLCLDVSRLLRSEAASFRAFAYEDVVEIVSGSMVPLDAVTFFLQHRETDTILTQEL